jgi:hypothetical protein
MSIRITAAVSILALFISLAPTALGISISSATNGVSSSENYKLSDDTSLQGKTTLGESSIFQKSEISGSGDNEASQYVSNGVYSAGNELKTSDSDHFSASTSTKASSQIAIKGLDIAGQGDIFASVSGVAGSTSTGQKAAVLNGDVSTSQSVATSDRFSFSSQNTGMIGDAGAIASKSFSAENDMAVVGGFSSSGDLQAKLASVASDNAGIYGSASMFGQELIDDNALQVIGANNLAMETDGIHTNSEGDLGDYGITAMNAIKSSQNNAGTGYQPAGWRWISNPQIHILLSGPSISNPTTVAQEISKSANTWDQNTRQNLFKGTDTVNTPAYSNAVEITSQLPAFGNNMDGKNIHAWTNKLNMPIIAQTTTWYYTNKFVTGADGKSYKQAVESDCWYNSNFGWRIAGAESSSSNTNMDIRTIATHELGHTIGLSDLYTSTDSNQIMYGYNNGAVKWLLRSGDKSGLWSLYGQ